MRFAKFTVLLLFIALIVAVALQNKEMLETSIRFQFHDALMSKNTWYTKELPLYVVAAVCFLVGGFLSLFYFLLDKIRVNGQLKACRTQVSKLEQELNSLRDMPLADKSFVEATTPVDPLAEQTEMTEAVEQVGDEEKK